MKKLEKGFTLIELMIVVAIIAILAAVAAPRFGAQIQKARDAKALEIVGTWRSALNLDYADRLEYATSFNDLTDNVDAGTNAKTTIGTTGSTASVAAGTPKTLTFTLSGTTTSADITIDASNGNNTQSTTWSSL